MKKNQKVIAILVQGTIKNVSEMNASTFKALGIGIKYIRLR